MPPIHPAAVSAGVIALSMAVAAAIAVYESPEVRRMADDLRRRIAIALHSLGEGIAPEENREPLFNRPEDADGFLMSRGPHAHSQQPSSHQTSSNQPHNDSEVDADEDSRRRQREELLYWNRMRLQQEQQAQPQPEPPSPSRYASVQEEVLHEAAAAIASVEEATHRAAAAAGLPMTTFDQLLQPDGSAERGTYVVNTGADYGYDSYNGQPTYNGYHYADVVQGGLVRRRRTDGVRGLHASHAYANPFSDEYGIDLDDEPEPNQNQNQNQNQDTLIPKLPQFLTPTPVSAPAAPAPLHALQTSTLSEGAYIGPEADELMSDIYDATPEPTFASMATASSVPPVPASVLLERALEQNEFTTASQAHVTESEAESVSSATASAPASAAADDAYSSIQAWAHTSSQHVSNSFYSPLPVSPVSAPSEPEMLSTGELTPTDSLSVIDAAETNETEDTQETQETRDTQETAETRSMTETVSTSAGSSTLAPSPADAAGGRYYDVISDSDSDGQMTPTSWTEVGSVLSESDASERGRA